MSRRVENRAVSFGTIALNTGQLQLLGYFLVWQGQEMTAMQGPVLMAAPVTEALRATDRFIGQVERLESMLLDRLDLDYRRLQHHTRLDKPMRAFLWDPQGPWTSNEAAERVTDDLMWLDMARSEVLSEFHQLRRRSHRSAPGRSLDLAPLGKTVAVLRHGLLSRIRLAQHAYQYVREDARESLKAFFNDDMRTAFEILTLDAAIRQLMAE